MKREIISKTYENILEDGKLIKLATITSFFHSLILLCLTMYQAYSIFQTYNGNVASFSQVGEILRFIINSGNWIWGIIGVGLVGLIGYYLVPPISDGAMIHYLEKKYNGGEGKISSSIGKGFGDFFSLFEFNGTMSIFNIVLLITYSARAWANGVLDNPLILGLLIIWALIVISIDILTPFTKYFIVLEKKKVFDAMKSSAQLSLENIGSTIKFVLIKYFLGLRFLINLILLIGFPVLIVYYGNEFFQNNLKNAMIILFIIMLIISAYITGIIEAFFMSFWYNVYKTFKSEKSQ